MMMTVLYSNLCHSEVCYKGTALYYHSLCSNSTQTHAMHMASFSKVLDCGSTMAQW